ncbi:MAG: SCO family protein [Gammaproteobacteria bacterium]|jgi:cytochrome oxidase Cu insertion factor (SCO1/SenC/PrrC family)|nr:SCO family protein [Gammaproteobacteria bacterium]
MKSSVRFSTTTSLLVIFLLPLVVASVLYKYRDTMPLPNPKSHGVLVQPVRQLAPFTITDNAGGELTLDLLKGKWTLVYVGADGCDLECQASLFKMRQARLALGEDMSRVSRLFLLEGDPGSAGVVEILEDYPRMMVAGVDRRVAETMFGTYPEGQIFMVDPLGNVMMRYDSTATTKGILKDIQRLLKYSRLG